MKNIPMVLTRGLVLMVALFAGCNSGEEAKLRELDRIEKLRAEERKKEEEEREHRRQEAYRLAEMAKDAIIDRKYQGGTNKGITIHEWGYDKIADRYLLKVSLNWDGTFFTSNHYSADGTVTFNSDGANTTWNPTWINSTLQEYQENMSIAGLVGGVIAIGAIGSTSSK